MKKIDQNLNNIKLKMLKEIKSDSILAEELTRLNVNKVTLESNVGAFYDYMKAIQEVKKCRDAGVCLHENQYHNLRLEVDAPYVTIHAEVCPVFYEKQQLMSRFVVQDFDPSLLELEISEIPERRIFNSYLTQLLAFSNDECKTIYASGTSGIGKLELAIPFLKRVAAKQEDVRVGVLNMPRFVREYAGDFYANKAIIDEHLEQYINIDYLVVDGLGNEETNKLIRDAIIFPLVSQRDALNKKTIYLSDITINELHRLYDYSLQDIRARQIISIIKAAIKDEIILVGTEL